MEVFTAHGADKLIPGNQPGSRPFKPVYIAMFLPREVPLYGPIITAAGARAADHWRKISDGFPPEELASGSPRCAMLRGTQLGLWSEYQ